MVKAKDLRHYEKDFLKQVPPRVKGLMLEKPLNFIIDVYYPNRRSDLDNCFKVVLDCLQKAEVIKNDNKVIQIIARKFIDPANPRIDFKVEEFEKEF
jgi:Holliday junction resolvase RusA-like endonuclease